jgi:hypothetical protein
MPSELAQCGHSCKGPQLDQEIHHMRATKGLYQLDISTPYRAAFLEALLACESIVYRFNN